MSTISTSNGSMEYNMIWNTLIFKWYKYSAWYWWPTRIHNKHDLFFEDDGEEFVTIMWLRLCIRYYRNI